MTVERVYNEFLSWRRIGNNTLTLNSYPLNWREPSLSHLFDLATREGGEALIKAWTVECLNHGQSVELNEDALKEGGVC